MFSMVGQNVTWTVATVMLDEALVITLIVPRKHISMNCTDLLQLLFYGFEFSHTH